MTREEITNSRVCQVTKAALEYYKEHHQDKDIDLTDAFKAGFEYADRTMIDKACEWFNKNLFEVINGMHSVSVMSVKDLSLEGFIKDFKKAMEL